MNFWKGGEAKRAEEKVVEKMAKDVVVGEFVMIKERPCAVIEILHSKPGKHLMKAMIRGENLLTRRKMEEVLRFESLVRVIEPEFYELEFVDMDKDDMVTLLDVNFQLKVLKLQEDEELKRAFLEQIEKSQNQGTIFSVKMVKVNGQEQMVGLRV